MMNVAVLKTNGGFSFENKNISKPKNDEALIRVLTCAVCTSDMHAWKYGLNEPTILGHEVVGIVEAVCENDYGIKPGDRVTGCILQGYAEYTTAKISELILVPDDFSNTQAIIEPCVCLLSGIRRLKLNSDSKIAIIGCGYMGLCLIALMKSENINNITAFDLRESQLKLALNIGAKRAFTPDEIKNEGYANYDYVFEVAGTQSAFSLAPQLVSQYGTIAAVAYHPYVRELDMNLCAAKAFTMVNVFEHRKENQLKYMREIIQKIKDKSIAIENLLTHSFPLSRLQEAFTYQSTKDDGYIKGYINDFKN